MDEMQDMKQSQESYLKTRFPQHRELSETDLQIRRQISLKF